MKENYSKEFANMVAGRLYNAADAELDVVHIKGMSQCEKFNKIPFKRRKAKQKALEKLIPSSAGKDLVIFSPFYCEYGININVGRECFANYNCTFLDCAPINLEDSVWIGANVTLATPMHPFLSDERKYSNYPDGYHDLEYAKPITIKKNCWICSGVTIAGGVTIGENSIIAAGAIVTKDIPPNCIAGGIPARVIRELDEEDRINVWDTYVKNEIPLSVRDRKKQKAEE